MRRVSVFLTIDQLAALKARALETGILQSEQIRRFMNLGLFADQQTQAKPHPKTAPLFAQDNIEKR